ncbi:PREDICTED: SH2 domain-containing protein 4A-like isoform X1 [Cyprinodon variegatus]|uniref:SH2 domain-containing protein 4A-like isoform X1 n=1 Tax=Cyprinodon variegatus TaxID=28743 RepID=UPI000742BB6C|nr:PREDICTED: SH2 domain-containing protein 4A-like isoform X1 [Cyprinodon variegatus]XP_015238302.1 PREDICTED: SH2 domain-containing protein 4A-like isoform X1 [Cyprinodon variegatus]
MLQQILNDMYIDPDVLEALNEEQKKTLFLKMRQEQVRRWKEREEKLEMEGGDKRTKPRKANSKSVSWMLGRDGDVSVLVIGEVDELTSKFINSGFGDKKTPSLQNNLRHQTILKCPTITQEVKSVCQSVPQKTQPAVSINSKEKCEETSTLRPLLPQEKAPSPTKEKSVSQAPMCSRLSARDIMGPASTSSTPGCINTRPGIGNLKPAASTPSSSTMGTVQLDSASASTSKRSPCSEEPQKAQDLTTGKETSALEKFRRAESVEAGKSLNAARFSRVALLKKNFSVDNPGRAIKPPLPTKPDHLRLTTTPTIR